MKKILCMLCAACAMMVASSCSEDEQPAVLEVAPTALTWEWDDVTPQTVTVTANNVWTATVSEPYWTLTPASDGKSLTVAPTTDNTGIGMDVVATVTITSAELVKTVILTHKGGPFVNGHEYVDLGLPSGLLWATCNLGASKPEEYGFYYGWGTDLYAEGYEGYYPYYFQLLGARDVYDAEYYDCGTDKDPLKDYCVGGSKYSIATEAGVADGIGGTEWDAARNTWMGEWRMPTMAEFDELCANCNFTWEARNGVNGYTVTSKINDNSIFLPAAGNQVSTYPGSTGERGSYRSSTIHANKQSAYNLGFASSYHKCNYSLRCYGYPIRPVVMK